MNRLEKYNIIKQEIDNWDPVFLYEDGCPPNEYSIEINKISSKIEEFNDVESLAVHIYNVFLEMFGNNTETKAKNVIECQEVAEKILNRIENQKY